MPKGKWRGAKTRLPQNIRSKAGRHKQHSKPLIPARPTVEHSHDKETDKYTKPHHRNDDKQVSQKRPRPMSGWIALAGIAIGSILLAIALTLYGRQGYNNLLL